MRTRAGIEMFPTPAANRSLVYIVQPDITEGWQQVIAQKAVIEVSRPHLKHTILQPLLCIVARKARPRAQDQSRRCRYAAPLARPPPGSALETPARHGRAAAGQLSQIKHTRPASWPVLHQAVFSLPIVQLAATASRPPLRASLRDGFASLDPAATHKDRGACEQPGSSGNPIAGMADGGWPAPGLRFGPMTCPSQDLFPYLSTRRPGKRGSKAIS
jgi:hypothetical protein